MFNHLRITLLISLLVHAIAGYAQTEVWAGDLQIEYMDGPYGFNRQEQSQIEEIARRSASEVNALITGLPENLKLSITGIERDLSSVGGVTGRADDPNTVAVYISTSFEGGVANAIDSGLAPVLYHEFHHLTRGWTMEGNKFGPGIVIAAINEGLANVFSEDHTGKAFAGNAYPEYADSWFREISTLPLNANYSHWMSEHPDGREAIGYKAGSYVIRQVMATSGLSVIELSALGVDDILALLGSSP